MSIDVSTFAADIPAGTYAIGDKIQLKNTAGPAIVRSSRGTPILKRITSSMVTDVAGSITKWHVYAKNADWIDPVESAAVPLSYATALDVRSGAIQSGHDCVLAPNSAWEVWAECVQGGTTTIDNSVMVDIEIDYPEVASIVDPTKLQGIPTSIEYKVSSLPINASGTATTSKWEVESVDIFKAGYQYALEKVELTSDSVSVAGHIAISDAAGMGGLTRIIPISNSRANIRPFIEYASLLVKGPMNVSFKLYNTAGSSTSDNVTVIFDFVKRKV